MRNTLLLQAIFARLTAAWAADSTTPGVASNAKAINIWFSSRYDLSGMGRNEAKAENEEMQ